MQLNLEQRVEKLEKRLCLCCPELGILPPDDGGGGATPFVLYTVNTISITLSGNGTITSKLQADVNISPQPNNILIQLSDGLYVGAPDNTTPLARNGTNLDTGWIEWGGLLIRNTVIDQDAASHYNINFTHGKLGFNMASAPTHTISVGDEIGAGEKLWIYAQDGQNANIEFAGAASQASASLNIRGKNVINMYPDFGSTGGSLTIDNTGVANQFISTAYNSGGAVKAGEVGVNILQAGVSYEFFLKAFDGGFPTYITIYDKIKLMNIPQDAAATKMVMIDANDNVRWRTFTGGNNLRFGVATEDVLGTADRAFDSGTHAFSHIGVTTYTQTSTTWTVTAPNANLKIAGYGAANNGDLLVLIDKTTGQVGWTTPAGGGGSGTIGGSTGGVDNAIIRANGTGGVTIQASAPLIDDAGNITPASNDASALGTSAIKWSDLFLASGGVINWNTGNVTLAHSAGLLTLTGALSVSGAVTFGGVITLSALTANKIAIIDGSNHLVSSTFAITDLNKLVVSAPIITNYTLVLADGENGLLDINFPAAGNVTIPPNASVPFVIGTVVTVVWNGVGQPSFVAGVGVTIRSEVGALRIAARYGFATVVKRGTNEWWLSGNIVV